MRSETHVQCPLLFLSLLPKFLSVDKLQHKSLIINFKKTRPSLVVLLHDNRWMERRHKEACLLNCLLQEWQKYNVSVLITQYTPRFDLLRPTSSIVSTFSSMALSHLLNVRGVDFVIGSHQKFYVQSLYHNPSHLMTNKRMSSNIFILAEFLNDNQGSQQSNTKPAWDLRVSQRCRFSVVFHTEDENSRYNSPPTRLHGGSMSPCNASQNTYYQDKATKSQTRL